MNNTPKAFLDYIKNSTFDYSNIRAWEIETLAPYFGGRAMLEMNIRDDRSKSERMSKLKCSQCSGNLETIRQPENSPLNRFTGLDI